jgi:predicted dehydrogenase
VFVEKPLALNEPELQQILEAYAGAEEKGVRPMLMVGYNRRFSDPVKTMQKWFTDRAEPLSMHYRINAGFLPRTHWYQQPEQGGRIIGECGHFVDTLQFLCGALPVSVCAVSPTDTTSRYSHDNVIFTIGFSDGSVGTIHYLASGSPVVDKEYIEVFGNGKIAQMFNFKKLEFATDRKKSTESFSGDKGHAAEMKTLLSTLREGGTLPVTLASIVATSRVTFAALESCKTGAVVNLSGEL